MADRQDKKTRRRSRSLSHEDERKKTSWASDRKKSSRARSRSPSKHHHKSRKRTSSDSSSSRSVSSSEERARKKRKTNKTMRKKKSRARSSSSSSVSTSSSSPSDSDSDGEYKRKKSKNAKTRSKKKAKKKEKKKSKKSKSAMSAINQNKYGKYGILTETDLYTKQAEFYCWLQEVKKVNPEIVGRFETKKYFDTFMEDFNTATLPHKKYYNLEKWEFKKSNKEKLKLATQKRKLSFADDEAKHTSTFRGGEKKYGVSLEKLIEMKKSIKERTEHEFKRNIGFEGADRK